MNYKEIEGDLISLAKKGVFDVITHGCNCQCVQGAGIAKRMTEEFDTDNELLYNLEGIKYKGDINKLGQIESYTHYIDNKDFIGYVEVVNSYTQFMYGRNHTDGVSKPLDYEALTLCLRKINHVFRGKRIGLPQVGAGLGGGSWEKIKEIIQKELKDCDVTVVIYKK